MAKGIGLDSLTIEKLKEAYGKDVCGDYAVESVIDRGQTGFVSRVVDRNGRHFAWKRPLIDEYEEPLKQTGKLYDRLMAGGSCDQIICYRGELGNGLLFDYCDWPTAAKELEAKHHFDASRALHIAADMLRALSFAEDNGLHHGDPALSHTFVSGNMARITDFFHATFLDKIDAAKKGRNEAQSYYGLERKVSIGYQADLVPDILYYGEIRKPNGYTDAFAVGVELYRMLFGERKSSGTEKKVLRLQKDPFAADNAGAIQAVLDRSRQSLSIQEWNSVAGADYAPYLSTKDMLADINRIIDPGNSELEAAVKGLYAALHRKSKGIHSDILGVCKAYDKMTRSTGERAKYEVSKAERAIQIMIEEDARKIVENLKSSKRKSIGELRDYNDWIEKIKTGPKGIIRIAENSKVIIDGKEKPVLRCGPFL